MRNAVKGLAVIGVAALVVAAVIGVGFWSLYGESGHAYVRIDNEQVSAIEPRAGMKFEYRLDAADANGAKSEITFQTERELRDGAYLELETKPLRGVVSWEERVPEELPTPARAALEQK